MKIEEESWPYRFPVSEDFYAADRRGSLSGRLLVRDRGTNDHAEITADTAYVGLALPGEAGSWQRESKGYQFWTTTEPGGFFSIRNIRNGEYGLYAWVTGFIGDYKYDKTITITSGSHVDLGDLVYEPPREGPTLWEIGIPDRSVREFYIPDPNPMYINKLCVNHPDRFRQYGLWEGYAELYHKDDLVYTVGVSDYTKDCFFAHVARRKDNGTYGATTWLIKFTMKQDQLVQGSTYKLRIALASAKDSELQVQVNDPKASPPHFSTGIIGGDNSIARHGIHGLYWLFNIDVQYSWLVEGHILMDNRDIRNMRLRSLRKHIGLVSQDIALFSGTVVENIGYKDLMGEINMEQVMNAAKIANADEFIRKLPDGYDTDIGQRGSVLSGGQRQRLAIARALYQESSILILDEATSALDSRSEMLVRQALECLTAKHTVIVIAHRIETVLMADRIFLLDGGKLKEISRSSFLAQDGQYGLPVANGVVV